MGFEAMVTSVQGDDCIIRMKSGPKQGQKVLCNAGELGLVPKNFELPSSEFMEMESRSSALMSMIRSFVLKISPQSLPNHAFLFKTAIENFKNRLEEDGSEGFWNDHHIIMLQDEEHEDELETLLGSSESNNDDKKSGKAACKGKQTNKLGREFRFLCMEAVRKKEVNGPSDATTAETLEGAKWCRKKQGNAKRMPYGTFENARNGGCATAMLAWI